MRDPFTIDVLFFLSNITMLINHAMFSFSLISSQLTMDMMSKVLQKVKHGPTMIEVELVLFLQA